MTKYQRIRRKQRVKKSKLELKARKAQLQQRLVVS